MIGATVTRTAPGAAQVTLPAITTGRAAARGPGAVIGRRGT
jgi:hypothetical protein